jgi:hypothetical protein
MIGRYSLTARRIVNHARSTDHVVEKVYIINP